MMLRFTFDLDEEATAIEKAVEAVLDKNYRTGDIMSAGCTQVGCSQMGDLLTAEIQKLVRVIQHMFDSENI